MIKCFYTNCDSLINKFDEFKIRVQENDPHIIRINEVKPQNCRYNIQGSELQLDNYEMFENLQQTGRGIVIYVKNNLKASCITELHKFEECVWISILLRGQDRLAVGCVYRSPNSSTENNEDLYRMMSNISNERYTHYLLVGDFNLPNINWKTNTPTINSTNSKEYKFIECMRDCFLFQRVETPTRCRIDTEPHILDLILCNQEESVWDISNESPIGKSDHSVPLFNYKCYMDQPNYKREKQFYDRGDYKAIRT